MTSKAKIPAVSFFIWLGKKRKRGKNMETKEKNVATPYDLDGKPPLKLAIPLGLQHVLAMFVGNLTPLLIITGVCGIESGSSIQVALLQNAMLVAGIVTRYTRSDRSAENYQSSWERVPVSSVSAEVLRSQWEVGLQDMEQSWRHVL